MPSGLATSLLNHLLAQSDWASSRLQPHSGKVLAIVCGPLQQRLAITAEGQFATATSDSDDVLITLPADTPLRLVLDRQSIFADAKLQGAADFTETLAFVFRHLRWDAEADLARLTGDIAAYRLLRLARDFFAWHSRSLNNLGSNLSEFFLEEESLFVQQRDFAALSHAQQLCTAELTALESRIRRLAGN